MSNGKPVITKVNFPVEGTLDYIFCVIAMTDDDVITSTFEAFIGVGININISDCSDSYRKFDETRVFNYAQDLDEFFDWYNNGGWDFKILDYEKEYENAGNWRI